MKRKLIGKILVEAGVITADELVAGLELQRDDEERRLGELLLEMGVIDEDRLAWCLAEILGLPVFNLNSIFIDPKVLRLLARERCDTLKVLPVSLLDGYLTLVMADPFDVTAYDLVRQITGLPVRQAVATESSIKKCILKYYSDAVGLEEIVSRIFPAADLNDDDFGLHEVFTPQESTEEYLREGDSTPVIRLVNSVIRDAIRMRSSDIHIEPTETSSIVRYRVDGILRNVVSLPLFLHPRNVCRIKILASMDISERRVPQDGSCRVRHKRNEYDLRISTMPTQFGEKVVIRVLSRQDAQVRLDVAGLLPDVLDQLNRVLSLPQGMILLTGPTGSGKTTTLYAMLQQLKGESKNIVTLEDPIEYNIPGIMQTQTHRRAGLSFEKGFRALLRQDPDVIMVGEIRDSQTADIAFNAAVTGHLVLTTIHANDTCSTPVRLAELGVSPFLLSTGLKAVVAQRLVRRLCTQCRIAYEPSPDTCRLLGLNPKEPVTLYRAGECKVCHRSGYYGRVGIFEVFLPSDKLKELILSRASGVDIHKQAVREGMRDLMEDAALRVIQGVTSLEEVMRLVPLEERRTLCPQCHRGVERYYHACPFCSFPLWKEICRTCGKEQDQDWKYCPYCEPSKRPNVETEKETSPSGCVGKVAEGDPSSKPLLEAESESQCTSCGMTLRSTWTECPLCLQTRDDQTDDEASVHNIRELLEISTKGATEPTSIPSRAGGSLPAAVIRPTLLVVTGDPATLIQISQVAGAEGFTVSQAEEAEEALRRISSTPLAGVILESIDSRAGSILWRKLKTQDVPCAVLVAQGASEVAEALRQEGATTMSLPVESSAISRIFPVHEDSVPGLTCQCDSISNGAGTNGRSTGDL